MIRVRDRVSHVTEGEGQVVAICRATKIVLVKWDSGSCTRHYLPYVHKVG